MMSTHDVPLMGEAGRLSVLGAANQRRRWSAEAKAQLVAETYASSVNEVAERYNVARNQLFEWRRKAKEQQSTSAFVPVEIAETSEPRAGRGGVIELQIGTISMRVPPGSDPAMVTMILAALKAAR